MIHIERLGECGLAWRRVMGVLALPGRWRRLHLTCGHVHDRFQSAPIPKNVLCRRCMECQRLRIQVKDAILHIPTSGPLRPLP